MNKRRGEILNTGKRWRTNTQVRRQLIRSVSFRFARFASEFLENRVIPSRTLDCDSSTSRDKVSTARFIYTEEEKEMAGCCTEYMLRKNPFLQELEKNP